MCNYSKSLKITLQITDKNIKILDKTEEIEINGCKHLVYYGVLEASSNSCPYCKECKITNNGYRKVKVKIVNVNLNMPKKFKIKMYILFICFLEKIF